MMRRSLLAHPLIVLAIVCAWSAVFFGAGLRYSSNEWALRYTEREHELLTAAFEQAAKVRVAEQAAADNFAAIGAAYEQGRNDVQDSADRTIADLRAGNLRLRRDLAAAACDLSDTAATATGSDERAATGLWGQAQADLVRLTEDADEVVLQLTACQSRLRAIYSMQGPSG